MRDGRLTDVKGLLKFTNTQSIVLSEKFEYLQADWIANCGEGLSMLVDLPLIEFGLSHRRQAVRIAAASKHWIGSRLIPFANPKTQRLHLVYGPVRSRTLY